MKPENYQIDWHSKIDELRKELDAKIDKKVSDKTFLTIVVIAASAMGALFIWLMAMNTKVACLETRIEISQPATIQQNLPQTPIKK